MLKWIGFMKGLEGLPGIPARDLRDDEIERLGGEHYLVATGLYERLVSDEVVIVDEPEVETFDEPVDEPVDEIDPTPHEAPHEDKE